MHVHNVLLSALYSLPKTEYGSSHQQSGKPGHFALCKQPVYSWSSETENH